MNSDINALQTSLFDVGTSTIKVIKGKENVAAAIQELVNNAAFVSAVESLIANITKLPADFSSLGFADVLGMVPGLITGVEGLITTAQAK